MQNAKTYRARARAQMGGNVFANNWLMALVLCLFYSLLISIASYIVIGAFLVEGFLAFGLAHSFLSVARGRKAAYDLFDLTAGKNQLADLVLLSLLKNIFLFLWMLVPVVGIVKYFSYSMTYYVKYDHPEYDWRRAITESRRMMKGHKWQLFCLRLSFLGWVIVGALTLGIGMLWVTPYTWAAEANFYEDLKQLEELEIDIPYLQV